MDIEKTAEMKKTTQVRYRRAILLGCTALVVSMPGLALAQQATTTETPTVLKTITVDGTGGRDDDSKSIVATRTTGGGKMATDIMDTAASVSVITAKEIQERNAQTVEQVLQYTAGVSTNFYGSDDRFDFSRSAVSMPTLIAMGCPSAVLLAAYAKNPMRLNALKF